MEKKCSNCQPPQNQWLLLPNLRFHLSSHLVLRFFMLAPLLAIANLIGTCIWFGMGYNSQEGRCSVSEDERKIIQGTRSFSESQSFSAAKDSMFWLSLQRKQKPCQPAILQEGQRQLWQQIQVRSEQAREICCRGKFCCNRQGMDLNFW